MEASIRQMINAMLELIQDLAQFGKNRVDDHKVFAEIPEPKQ